MDGLNNDTPTGLDSGHIKIHNHLTPTGFTGYEKMKFADPSTGDKIIQ
jgi:hypothetical protein